MLRSIAVLIVVCLAGCSSNKVMQNAQYCYTDQTIRKKDGVVSSDTTLQCTDRPGQQMSIQRAGIDKSCKEFWYDEYRNGIRYQQRGVRCEKLDGSWEILNINGTVN